MKKNVSHHLNPFSNYLNFLSLLGLGYVLWWFICHLINLYGGLSSYLVDMTVQCWVGNVFKMFCWYHHYNVLLQRSKVLYWNLKHCGRECAASVAGPQRMPAHPWRLILLRNFFEVRFCSDPVTVCYHHMSSRLLFIYFFIDLGNSQRNSLK